VSYVRWSRESSVYIYEDVHGGITCCDCANLSTTEAMIAHVEWHIARGDVVPDYVIPRLQAHQDFN